MARIGTLDQKITIQEFSPVRTLSGEALKIWSNRQIVWAKVEYSKGATNFEDAEKVAVQKVDFTIRYTQGLTELMRIYFDSKYYDIISISGTERKRYLKITGTEKNNKNG